MIANMKRMMSAGLIFSMLLGLIAVPVVHAEPIEQTASEVSPVVSKRVSTPDGHNYLEVDGKPILYNAIELRTDKYHLVAGAPLADEEILFDKAKELNYKIVSPILTWRDIEPILGTRDYTVIDQYIDWANEKDLYLDLVWFGINVDSVVWTKFAPPDLWNNPDYPHILNSDNTWLTYGLGGFGQALTMDMSSPAIKARELAVFQDLWNHIAEKDVHHRLISVQIQNETGQLYQFPDDVIVPYIRAMADIVKQSSHSVFTRMNNPKIDLIETYLQNNIDSLGYDPYTNKIRDPETPSRGLEYWQDLFNTGGNWYAVHENGAHGMDVYDPDKPDYNVTNVPTLMMYTFSNGYGYNSYHIEDDANPAWFWNTGMFTRSQYGPANAVDLDDNTYYRSDTLTDLLDAKPAYLLATINGFTDQNGNIQPGNQTIDGFTVKVSRGIDQGPTAWTVYTSQDGETYTAQGSIENVIWSYNDDTIESQTISFPPVDNVNYLKVEFTAANLAAQYFAVNEISATYEGVELGLSNDAYGNSIYLTYDYRGSTQAVKELNEMLNVKDNGGYHLAKLAPGKQASYYNVDTSYPQNTYKATKDTAGVPISYSTSEGGLGFAGVEYEANQIILMSNQAGIYTIHNLELPTSVQAGAFDSNMAWSGTTIPIEGTSGNFSVKLEAGDVVRLYYHSGIAAVSTDTDISWINGSLPSTSVTQAFGGDKWNWVATSPTPMLGTSAHQSIDAEIAHGHSFVSQQAFYVGEQENIYTYVYIDPASPPKEVMLSFHDGAGWAHRAYWGQNVIDKGINGTNSRRYMGQLPASGRWVRLEVPAERIGLSGKTVWGVGYEVNKGKVTFDQTGRTKAHVLPAVQTEVIWFDDSLPAGANAVSWGGDTWKWVESEPMPYSGTKAHQSSNSAGGHGALFENATSPLKLEQGDLLNVYVYINPDAIPRQILLHFKTGWDWEHRAYWGERLIPQGTDGTDSSRRMGDIPEAGKWVKLEIPISAVGLAGKSINGICFELFDGQVTWDAVGKGKPQTEQVVSSDATLRALLVKDAATEGIYSLREPFSLQVADYSVSVPNTVSSIRLVPTVSEIHATVSVNEEALGGGKASASIALNEGANLFTVIVTAEDGTLKPYTVTVTRQAPEAPNPGNGGGGGVTSGSSEGPIVTGDGKLNLPSGKGGKTSLNESFILTVPDGATEKPLQVKIEKVSDTDKQVIFTGNHVLVSDIYEIASNGADSLKKSIQITIKLDPSAMKVDQPLSIYSYDAHKKAWIERGGEITDNQISIAIDRLEPLTRFAVFALQKTEEPTQASQPVLTDITGHWAEKNIKRAIDMNVIQGYADGTFKPNKSVTRAEFTVMLVNALSLAGEGGKLTFLDEEKIGAWAKAAVAKAVAQGLVNGYADGSFRPDAKIKRAEMAVILARVLEGQAAASGDTGFADNADIPVWARGAVETLRLKGLIQGRGNNRFAPGETATRAEAVTLLLQLLDSRS